MSTISKLIQKAKGEIGVKESPSNSNNVKYNTAYYGRAVNGSAYPWCCAFIWWLFKECGASDLFYGGKKTASCTTLANYYKSKGQFSQTPKVGSLVFFDWGEGGSTAYHIGIVIEVKSSSTIVTVEGNTGTANDSDGGAVMKRTRYSSQVLGYAYPYDEDDGTTATIETPVKLTTGGGASKVSISLDTLKNGSKGNSVKALQTLLNGYGYNCGEVDGEIGVKTVGAVKKFQKAKSLTQDGIVGAKTWAALLGA